jgi:DDE superfamily endonuclease
MGRRTVIRILWALGPLVNAHPCSYHRFFSAARRSIWTLAKVQAAMVMELVPANQPVIMEGDDTVTRHRGKKVFGKGWHRDAIQSSQGHLHMMLGHKWVVLAVNVKLPGCNRPWALPVLASLYVPPPKEPSAAAHGQVRRQTKAGKASDTDLSRSKLPVLRKRDDAGLLQPRCKSPCFPLRQMLAAVIHWFPDRKFILLGDGGFASHDLA